MNPLDPFTDEFQQCPFPALAELREHSPVQALAEPGWYIVTTMDLVREVLADPARFSNAVSRRTPPPPEVADQVAAIRARGFPYVATLLLNDPPCTPATGGWCSARSLRVPCRGWSRWSPTWRRNWPPSCPTADRSTSSRRSPGRSRSGPSPGCSACR